ncbi:hypothetical protein POTOM_004592 [Populus tomentosa]|uniref:Uncharacterized protein n=1 Tax=Populus tomentosa TaxID=118781 RepID=A0A8X8DDK3_POPTO|nr:hypothetical protein POTOM_004592 [Populus tomentosa]
MMLCISFPFERLTLSGDGLQYFSKSTSGTRRPLSSLCLEHQRRLWAVLSTKLPNLRVLGLSNCNLAGVLHPSLLQLGQLTDLQLSGNNFSSRVPDFLAKFSSLKTLHLSYCGLYGIFPNSLFLMRTLRSLDVSYNSNLTGTLPAEFPSGSRLEVINLSGTMFMGNLPHSIVNLVFLQDLEISQCSFSGSIPSSFENLTELRYLDFGRNNFSGPVPSLALSEKISGLIFSHNHFSGFIPLSYANGLNYLEVLDLRNNSLKGMIPPALFTKPLLWRLDLSQNQLNGQLKEFKNASSSLLRVMHLDINELQGPIPESIFKIRGLNVLGLSSNQFNGTINFEMIKDTNELTTLDLSGNNFSFEVSGVNSTLFSHIGKLALGSCNLKEIPGFLTNLMNLFHLDLSNNKIKGEIPKWVWKLGNENLVYLNLSNNMLSGFEKPFPNLSPGKLAVLDLHSNFLQGPFLMPSPSIIHLDYSHNQFSSSLPSRIFENLTYASFVSLSSNHFNGEIPFSMCETWNLVVLDLSKNHFNGSIPECLGNSNSFLKVLNLRNNELHGILPKRFAENCTLRTLDVNQNHLEGPLPRSLANCGDLEVLDVGNNFLNGSFPFWLETLPLLRVLILRSNFFGGSIIYSPSKTSFPLLQIIDLASNKFRGNLSSEWFKSWKGMMKQEKKSQSSQVLRYSYLVLTPFYYKDSVTLVNKGLNMELEKILTIFTSIDLSNNLFEGEIPEKIGDLDLLYVLNLSNNHLTGQIPSSFRKLKELGSLDLSENRLSGTIPQQLTTLTFLSVLKLSQNLLVGEIPQGNQFGTFTSAAFEGNIGLCGPPLTNTCPHALPPMEPNADHGNSTWGVDWNYYWIGFGCGGGMGLNIGLQICYCNEANAKPKCSKLYASMIDKG